MDYDQIVKNRRRNWDALKPDEVRQREKEEAREKRRKEREEKEKTVPATSYDRLRRRLREESERQDKELFERAVRQGGILVGGFVLLIALFYGWGRYLTYRTEQDYLRSLSKFDLALVDGRIVVDLSNPVGALATWRSAWAEGNMDRAVNIFSRSYQAKLKIPKEDLIRDYKDRYFTNRMEDQLAIIQNFEGAEMIRVNRKPWKDGELAIFRSAFLQRVDEKPPGIRYIVAFSWDAGANEWRFADLREDYFFNVNWNRENMIKPLRKGPSAPRFDITGKQILGGRGINDLSDP